MEKESVVKFISIELGGWVERNVFLKDFSFVVVFGGKNNFFVLLYVFFVYF